MLLEERARNETLKMKMEESVQDLLVKQKKISTLKEEIRQLSDALRTEKEKSRLTILKLLDDVEDAIADSIDLKEDANRKMSSAEMAVFKEKEKAQKAIKKEREYNSLAVASCKLNFICHRYSSSPMPLSLTYD